MIKIKTTNTDEAPEARLPVIGLWYHGVDHQGRVGALAKCVWIKVATAPHAMTDSSYETGEGVSIDMGQYAHLEEHPAK